MTRRCSPLYPLLTASLCALLVACSPSGDAVSDAEPPSQSSIAEVQGTAPSSPYLNRSVTVTGIVTARFDLASAGARRRFALQDESPSAVAGASTGLIVELKNDDVGIAAGDRVSVTGRVGEFDGETRLVADEISRLGSGSIEPARLSLPLDDLERYEGMRVVFDQPMGVADSYNLERYGTLLLYAGERPRIFTSVSAPDRDGFARHQAEFSSRTLLLDDGSWAENVRPIRFLLPAFRDDTSRPIRVGDTVTAATGILRYTRDAESSGRPAWRLVATEPVQFMAGNDRPERPAKATGHLRVVGFNAQNFFPTVDQGGATCGPSALGCRGADSAAEFARQRAKLARALLGMDADIVALTEVENDGGRALALITDDLSDKSGQPWSYIDTRAVGGDAIRVALIFNSATVRPVNAFAILDASVDASFVDSRNRPVLAQTFEASQTGERFTVAANHLKSKGSDCDDLGDPDAGDGQGNCNLTRLRAAAAEIRWLATDPTASGDTDRLIIGDLNAYHFEEPVQAFISAGYVDLLEQGTDEFSYSYVFRGESGVLDHALATASLANKVRSARAWHINADEARALDYNLDFGRRASQFDAETVYRASDHDPIIVDIDINQR